MHLAYILLNLNLHLFIEFQYCWTIWQSHPPLCPSALSWACSALSRCNFSDIIVWYKNIDERLCLTLINQACSGAKSDSTQYCNRRSSNITFWFGERAPKCLKYPNTSDLINLYILSPSGYSVHVSSLHQPVPRWWLVLTLPLTVWWVVLLLHTQKDLGVCTQLCEIWWFYIYTLWTHSFIHIRCHFATSVITTVWFGNGSEHLV